MEFSPTIFILLPLRVLLCHSQRNAARIARRCVSCFGRGVRPPCSASFQTGFLHRLGWRSCSAFPTSLLLNSVSPGHGPAVLVTASTHKCVRPLSGRMRCWTPGATEVLPTQSHVWVACWSRMTSLPASSGRAISTYSAIPGLKIEVLASWRDIYEVRSSGYAFMFSRKYVIATLLVSSVQLFVPICEELHVEKWNTTIIRRKKIALSEYNGSQNRLGRSNGGTFFSLNFKTILHYLWEILPFHLVWEWYFVHIFF